MSKLLNIRGETKKMQKNDYTKLNQNFSFFGSHVCEWPKNRRELQCRFSAVYIYTYVRNCTQFGVYMYITSGRSCTFEYIKFIEPNKSGPMWIDRIRNKIQKSKIKNNFEFLYQETGRM